MPHIPGGFAHVILSVVHASLARPTAVTWGVGFELVPSQILAGQIVSDFVTPMAPNFDSQTTLGPATVYFGNAFLGSIPFDVPTEVLGSRVMDSPPPNVAVLVRKSTNVPGRKGRGRMYLPWAIADTELSETGVVTAPLQVAIDIDLDTWRTGATAADRPLYLLHTDPVTLPSPIIDMTVQNIIANQRRRLVR